MGTWFKNKTKQKNEQLYLVTFILKERRAFCPLCSGSVHLWSALDFLWQDAELSGLRSGWMTAMATTILGPACTAPASYWQETGSSPEGISSGKAEVLLGLTASFLQFLALLLTLCALWAGIMLKRVRMSYICDLGQTCLLLQFSFFTWAAGRNTQKIVSNGEHLPWAKCCPDSFHMPISSVLTAPDGQLYDKQGNQVSEWLYSRTHRWN